MENQETVATDKRLNFDELLELIGKKDYKSVRQKFKTLEPADIAELLTAE